MGPMRSLSRSSFGAAAHCAEARAAGCLAASASPLRRLPAHNLRQGCEDSLEASLADSTAGPTACLLLSGSNWRHRSRLLDRGRMQMRESHSTCMPEVKGDLTLDGVLVGRR